MIDNLTHWQKGSERTSAEGYTMVRAFELGDCETCGGPVQEVNSVWLDKGSALQFLKAHTGELPPEISFDDDSGMTNCDHCC